MADTLSSTMIVGKNAAHSIAPWVWLFEVDLDGANALRIAGYDTAIIFGGYTYAAFPCAMSTITRDQDGSITPMRITVSNVSREVTTYLEAGSIIDRTVQIRLVLSTDLTTSQNWGKGVILDATASLEVATFTVGVLPLFDVPFPSRRFDRGRCDYIFGQSECGFDTTQTNTIGGSFSCTTCDLTLEGANGCRQKGVNEAANGRTVNHPLRFGGHPSIPRGPARV